MTILDIGIDGVVPVTLTLHRDDRGSLSEVYRGSWLPGAGPMVQANLSRSRAGVLRGMHFHRLQADLQVFAGGVSTIGLFDLRSGSPSEGRSATVPVDAGDAALGLYIPPGVAHGFCAVTEVTLIYLVDEEFTGEDEHGIAWDDPGLGIRWRVASPTLSARDRANPSLAEVLRDPPAYAVR